MTNLLLIPLALGTAVQDTVIPIPAGAPVQIMAAAGEVVVRGWDRQGVGLVTSPSQQPVLTRSGDTIRIVLDLPGTLTVHLPRESSVWITGRQPTIRVENVPGRVSAETESGPITVTDVGSVEARSGSGEVTAHGVMGEAILRSNTNTIRADSVRGRLAVESVTGMIYVDAPLGQQVDGFTVTGELHVRGRLDRGRYRLETHTGEIVVRLEPGSSATFQIESEPGALAVGIPEARTTPGANRRAHRVIVGDGAAEITAETFNGAVRVQPASPRRDESSRSHDR